MSWEHTFCRDCGINAWSFIDEDGRLVHEDFYVDNELWDMACPDDEVRTFAEDGHTFREGTFVLCIGCFERRLGRRLTRDDFTWPVYTHKAPWPGPGTPPSLRFADRWWTLHRPTSEQFTLELEASP